MMSSDAEWAWTLKRTIPSSTEIGHEVIEELLSALNDAGWDGSDLFHVQMAAEEAMVNAVTHGNDSSKDKSVEMEFRVSKDSAYLRFKDEGCGFCPDDLPDPRDDENVDTMHGRGVFLIKQMMTQVTYNESGNEVTMIKHRQAAHADSSDS